MRTIRLILAGGLLLAAAGGNIVHADENPREVALAINQANDLLRNKDVNGAISAYEQVQSQAPTSAELSYDLAVAHYRQGDLAAAQRLFQTTAANHDHALAAKARYNLGNCDYAAALSQAKTAPALAVGSLDQAIENYRSALAFDNTDSDARTNLELAATLRNKLRRQQHQPPPQQPPQEGQQSPNEKQSANDQSSHPHQPASGQPQPDNQQSESAAKKDPPDQTPRPAGQQGRSAEQKDNQDKPGGQDAKSANPKAANQQQRSPSAAPHAQRPPTPSQPQPQTPENSDRKGSASATTNSAESPLGNKAPNTASPAASSKRSAGKPSAGQSTEQQGTAAPPGALAPALQPDRTAGRPGTVDRDAATDDPMTQQEAEKMLQSIRDRDMIRRFEHQAAERNRHVPVDRDW